MKMEMVVESPCAGTVDKVYVSDGQKVTLRVGDARKLRG